MSRPASAIFFIGAPRQRFANNRVVAAAAKGVAAFECQRGKALGAAGETRRIGLEDLANMLRSRSPKGRSFSVHFSQHGAGQSDRKHVCHTLVNTTLAGQTQLRLFS